MADHTDVRLGDRLDTRNHPASALELDHVSAAFLEHPDRVRYRLLVGHFVAPEWHIGNHERPSRGTRNRARQEDHVVDRYGNRRLVPEHHHRCRITDEDQLDASLVGEQRARSVVRGDHRDLVAAALHLDKLGEWQLSRSGG